MMRKQWDQSGSRFDLASEMNKFIIEKGSSYDKEDYLDISAMIKFADNQEREFNDWNSMREQALAPRKRFSVMDEDEEKMLMVEAGKKQDNFLKRQKKSGMIDGEASEGESVDSDGTF